MRIVLVPLVVIATLSSCGGGGGGPTPPPPDSNVFVIKSRGAVQCTTAPMPLETLGRQLTDAGVPLVNVIGIEPNAPSCGVDGKAYPAACGSPTGQIGIFLIAEYQLPKATAAGFVLMSSEPGAKKSDC
ncbi:MAG: hypothetical protein V4857_15240 [Pseudomonadota bacterium]